MADANSQVIFTFHWQKVSKFKLKMIISMWENSSAFSYNANLQNILHKTQTFKLAESIVSEDVQLVIHCLWRGVLLQQKVSVQNQEETATCMWGDCLYKIEHACGWKRCPGLARERWQTHLQGAEISRRRLKFEAKNIFKSLSSSKMQCIQISLLSWEILEAFQINKYLK